MTLFTFTKTVETRTAYEVKWFDSKANLWKFDIFETQREAQNYLNKNDSLITEATIYKKEWLQDYKNGEFKPSITNWRGDPNGN